MDDIKVTLIISVYNEERSLPKALDSAVFQTLKELEIICVNDGSTDYTSRILELYAMKYPNIRIITQGNLGSGNAMNKALLLSHGEYVYILNARDVLEIDALDKMYKMAKRNSSDVVFAPFAVFDDELEFEKNRISNKTFFPIPEYLKEKTIKPEEIYSILFDIPPVCWGKLIKKSYLEQNKICFVENLSFKDFLFLIEIILRAKNIMTLGEVLLYHKKSPKEDYKKMDLFDIYRATEELLKELRTPRSLISKFKTHKKNSLVQYYDTILDRNIRFKYRCRLLKIYPEFYFKRIKWTFWKFYRFSLCSRYGEKWKK